jgi:hypothetical protein
VGLHSSKNTTYKVTGTVPGWFGPRKVTKTVVGRRATEREMTRMQRRGAHNVRRTRGAWWMG